jgi:hypothetical protein
MQPGRYENDPTNRGVNVLSLFRSLALTALVSFSPLSPFVLHAQDKRGFETAARAVSGVVSDSAGKPAAGAVVLLKNTKTLQVRSYVTKDDGTYRFLGLSSNDTYELRAQRNGSSSGSKTLSQFDSHKEAQINLKLK